MYHCGLVFVLVLCTVAHAVKPGDLYKALDTNDPIWMRKRSYNREGHTCVRSIKINLTQTDYKFNQTFKNSSGEQSEVLFAQLHDNEKPLYMNVSKLQGSSGMRYRLQFWDENEKCGVLTLRPSGKQGPKLCEMFAVSARRLSYGAPNCEDAV
ncbi:hypothetical protein MTO96_033579 [Rhipicephalus appendiculatus]